MTEPPTTNNVDDWVKWLAHTEHAKPRRDVVGEIIRRVEYLDNFAGFVGGRTGDLLGQCADDLRRYAAAIATGKVQP